MEKKIETRKKVMKIAVWIVAILALMASVHIMVNYFQVLEIIMKLHGR